MKLDPYNHFHFIVVSFQLFEEGGVGKLPFSSLLPPTKSEHAHKLFELLAATWSHKNMGHKIKCKSILYEILYHLFLNYLQKENSSKAFLQIHTAKDLILCNIFSYSEIAEKDKKDTKS